ncbi:SpoIID/LytB domain-containing protein [Bdellovibrionota bacterium FG-2]
MKNLRRILALASFVSVCTFTLAAFANEQVEVFNNPVFRGSQHIVAHRFALESLLSFNPVPPPPASIRLPIDLVRVKVFPHNDTYSQPQGREAIVGHVRFKSAGSCELKLTTGTVKKFAPAKTFRIDTSVVGEGVASLKCTSTTQVLREGGFSTHTYNGTFELRFEEATVKPTLTVINILPFETYLKGVVPSEMPAGWPHQSLKAQAIAARTYAAFQVNDRRTNSPGLFYDVIDTVEDQAYRGQGAEAMAASVAVDETRGQVLTYRDNPIIAYFSADSGGFTEIAMNVWGNDLPYTPTKPEVYDPHSIATAWKRQISRASAQASLLSDGLIPPGFVVKKIEIPNDSRSVSGRALQVLLTANDGQTISVFGELFRHALQLRSTLFDLSGSGPFTFNGKGFGHGVGMNQTGAKVLVQQFNWTHEQILGFYYTGVKLEQL